MGLWDNMKIKDVLQQVPSTQPAEIHHLQPNFRLDTCNAKLVSIFTRLKDIETKVAAVNERESDAVQQCRALREQLRRERLTALAQLRKERERLDYFVGCFGGEIVWNHDELDDNPDLIREADVVTHPYEVTEGDAG
ncbi:MAG: hypothetical protein AB7V46_19515 [Thermomicrobiales bacterium]